MSVIEQSHVIPTGTWSADPSHSQIEFEVRYMGLTTIRGWAAIDSATLNVNGGQPKLDGVVKTANLTTLEEKRDGHLASPDFFDIERYPEISFSSTDVEVEDAGNVNVTGELTIKGVTKPVVLSGRVTGTGEDPWGNTRVGVDLGATVNRKDFGVSWNAPLPGGGFLLNDDVKLNARFSFLKQS